MNARRALVAAIAIAAFPLLFAVAAEAQPAATPVAATRVATVPAGAQSCSGCHGSQDGPVPRLIGRNAAEIVEQMQAFRSGQREATVMDKIAKGFSDAEIQAIAGWYADQR